MSLVFELLNSLFNGGKATYLSENKRLLNLSFFKLFKILMDKIQLFKGKLNTLEVHNIQYLANYYIKEAVYYEQIDKCLKSG